MNLELDLACIALSIVIHNQDAVERYTETHSVSYEAQGWKDLEGGVHGKCQASYKGLRGLRRLPCGLRKPGRTGYSKILGGTQ